MIGNMKILTLTTLLFFSTIIFADGLAYNPMSTERVLIGEERVKVTVVFDTSKYHLDQCSTSESPKGFFVVEREDNKKLMFFCGTTKKRGDTFEILVEKGI
jgi:hypothetical protein